MSATCGTSTSPAVGGGSRQLARGARQQHASHMQQPAEVRAAARPRHCWGEATGRGSPHLERSQTLILLRPLAPDNRVFGGLAFQTASKRPRPTSCLHPHKGSARIFVELLYYQRRHPYSGLVVFEESSGCTETRDPPAHLHWMQRARPGRRRDECAAKPNHEVLLGRER
jgi:hypothetical protein